MKFVKSIVVLFVSAFLLLASGALDRAEALLDSHECTFCHNLHGGPGYETLLAAETSEQVCLSCHTVSINDTAAAEVHNPLGLASNQSGYITCRECHDAHSNQGGNIKLIGYRKDGENWFESFTPPAIRKELPSTIGLTYNVVTFTSSADFNIAGSAIGVCEVCHDPHHNAGNDCTQCHSHSSGFPSPDCTATGCHDGNGTGALAVGVGSSHSTDTIFASKGVTFTCGDCHTSHLAGNVQVPNKPAVGINYSTSGHNGISLGSSIATGTTEAEICWNCHATYSVSEWGLNSDTNGSGSNYNFGTLSGAVAPAWVNAAGTTGASWSSAETLFAYKTGNIQSTHSVNNSATLPGLDPVANIRCSYCHDVHELNLASGDTTSGKPFLRGSWQGNPYREDGAPQSSVTYASQGDFGAVPRGGTGASEMGGYQIDQNNGNPTNGWTLSSSAGICTLCHGTNVNTMNYFGTASDDWVGTNGHSNAVIGGTGAGSNIFNESDRKLVDGYCPPSSGTDIDGLGNAGDSYCAGYPNMAYQQHSDENTLEAYGLRGTSGQGSGFFVKPPVNAARPFAYNDYNWGATVDTGTTDNNYHQFSCSKCHNPHASRLPRLMITNCLDTKHNTWDDSPKTMVNGDTITISSSACYNNQTFTVKGLDVKNDRILLDVSSFGGDCSSNGSLTLTWNATNYSLSRYVFKNSGAEITADSTTYTFDTLELNSTNDLAQFIGRQVSSSPSPNGAEKSHIYLDNDGVTLSNATSAQNCHRLADPAFPNAGGSGWNKVTPW